MMVGLSDAFDQEIHDSLSAIGADGWVVPEGDGGPFLSDGKDEPLTRYEAGEYFGELGPLLGFPRAATARAREPSVCTVYSVADFKAFLGADRVADVVADGKRPRGRRRSSAVSSR